MRSFVAADGFQVVATSSDPEARKKLQGILDRFWCLNELDENLSQLVDTLGVDGELVFFASEPNLSGDVKLCKLPAEIISGIEADPVDSMRLEKVCLVKEIVVRQNGVDFTTKELDVVNRTDDGWYAGQVQLLQINKLAGQTRGFSDMLPVVDWLDALNRLLYTEVERFQMQKAMSYDVTLKGDADDSKVIARAQEIESDGPPNAGDVNVHTESEEWKVCVPDMKLTDSVEFIRFVLMICCGGLNMPPHWFAEGGDVNKATASEMGTPIWAFIRDRKRALTAFLRRVIRHALWMARDIHMIPEDQLEFSIVSRDPDPSAFNLIGRGLVDFLKTLVQAVQGKMMSQLEARRFWRNCLQGLGLGQLLEPVDGSGDQADMSAAVDQLNDPTMQEAIVRHYLDRYSATAIDAGLRAEEEHRARAFATPL